MAVGEEAVAMEVAEKVEEKEAAAQAAGMEAAAMAGVAQKATAIWEVAKTVSEPLGEAAMAPVTLERAAEGVMALVPRARVAEAAKAQGSMVMG